ncbi:UNVERIFIED_CONTAM: hypothetical protein PYX00_004941 [Menopon gallinae]
MVLNKLCSCLSVYLLQTCPGKWSDALPELLVTFTPENLPQIPADAAIWVLLELLTVLPKELSFIHLPQNQRGLIRHHLTENSVAVLNLLEKIISNHNDHEIILEAVGCVSSWMDIGVQLTECQNLINILISLVFNAHKHHTSICEKALDALGRLVSQPDTCKYPTYVLDFLTKILPLREIIVRELMSPEPDQDLINEVYSLFISFGETHTQLCLDWIKQDGMPRQQVMALVTCLLHCSGATGCYPTDETHSRLAFGFWYILQDLICNSKVEDYELYIKLLGPIYKELLEVLMVKAQLPDPKLNLSQDDLESFRCYRQDIGDTLTCCYTILRVTTISLIKSRFEKVNVEESSWRELEACLFILCSIAEHVHLHEDHFLPALFQFIGNLPFQRLNPKVLATALDTIGAYAEWISQHSTILEHILPLITLGLNAPETAPNATMALKDLTRYCQCAIKPYAGFILDACQKALHGGRLKLNESTRLMYSVGRILSILPLDVIMQYLDVILSPYLDQLNSLSMEQPSAQVKNNILLCLKMIGTLSGTLDIRPDPYSENVSPSSDPQPVLLILHKLLPVIKLIFNAWPTDSHVTQSIFSALKYAVTTLLEESKPVMTDILDLILTTYRVHPQPTALDLTRQFCLLFGQNEEYEPMMQSLTNELCTVTVTTLSSSPNISDHTELIESLFTFLSHIIKKVPKLFIYLDAASLLQCATFSLGIAEVPTVKAATSFIVNLITQSRELASLSNVVNMYGEQLVLKIISCIAGEASRWNIDPLADILLALNKKYCDNHSRWLHHAVNENLCRRTTPQQREHFIKMVLKERVNKRRLQDTVKEFSQICRGCVLYDVQNTPFF